ncbi:T9SS type A sorting domain-containing protein [uncultured Winogradskyella sp.]|uniref:T9SS type A sorting domain-containing protein n=1 Tax=uncultured Winogradskyella sp. TaxID=395353 RepID=UPI00260980B1|nr:T9SS type A sorting domain-containing protein [uncultured Winogradskyella sp.]
MKKILQLGFYTLFIININVQQAESQNIETIPVAILERDDYYNQLLNSVENDLSQLKGSGYMQYMRERWFYEQRRNADGISNVKDRWNIFQSIRELGERSGTGPMANWQNIGPIDMDGHGGRMISHAFDPIVPDVIWGGSASGGLWLSEDAGDNWVPMTDNIPSTGVGAVVVKPDDSDIVIIGTGEGYSSPGIVLKGGIGVFKSTDRGLTWLPTNFSFSSALGVSVLKIAWHPTNTNILWMAATNGLWKSIDGGDNWAVVLGDGTNHQNFIFNDIIIQNDNPDVIFVARENVGIYKSIDGGNNFSLLSNGLPSSNINFISIDQSMSNPNVLYTSITRANDTGLLGVYKSIDNGENWSILNNAPDAFCIVNSLGLFCQGWFNNTIAVSPVDPDLVFFGGISFWRSSNGGMTWQQKDRTACSTCTDTPVCMTYADHHDLGFDPHNPSTVYTFNDGGVSKSTDNGSCWSNANNGLVNAQFLSVGSGRSNTNIVIGGLWDHGLQGANIGNGLNWERWGFFDGVNVAVDVVNPNNFYGTWINGTYWKSSNGTNSFASQITGGMNLNENTSNHFAPLRMHPSNPNILLGSTQQGLYKSSSAGVFWQKNLNAAIITDLAFSQANPSVCYAAAWTNASWTVYRSNDTGETWQPTMSAPGWRMTDIKTSGLNSDTVFISRNSINSNTPHIYKTINGGDSWSSIQGDLPDIQVNAIAVDLTDDDIIYAATDLGVYITINGGANWTEFNHGLPITFVTDIEYNPVDSKLRIATFGRGIWISDAYNVLSVEEYEGFNDISIFPNPVRDNKISIRFQNGIFPEDITIEVLNYLGQQLHSFNNEDLDFIDNQTIEIRSFGFNKSEGIYFLRISSSNKSVVKKLIKD